MTPPPESPPRVVVVGGGFAGIEVIKTLRRLKIPVAITLVTRQAVFEYYPALYKLVTGALPIEVSVPVRTIFADSTIAIVQGIFTGVAKEQKTLSVTVEGKEQHYPYDYLVLALGSETNFFNIKGLPELSYSFKSVAAALRLKEHFCTLFSKAATLSKEELVSMLHIIIVGAGPSGVELAGDLRSYLRRVAKEFKVDPSLITIDLIEAGNRVLPTLPEKVSVKAEARLRKMGVNIFINRALAAQEVEEVILKDMQVSSHTVIWTAGTRINSAYLSLPDVTLDARKRVVVSPSLTLPDSTDIFIAGDGAATLYSGLAQTAIEHGRYIGKVIAATVRNKKFPPYAPKQPSFVIPIGVNWALFVHKKFVVSGFLPWLLRSVVDFRYFLHIVPLSHVFAVFRKGMKYRKVAGGCPIDTKGKAID
ncbi:MAG TPA: FAD-dependent oxidoreductase [Candidatus Paceibacterota bacterium]|nr:FAD-dependent oxidoreductase [Candidatus Paceibacterota bacterium]